MGLTKDGETLQQRRGLGVADDDGTGNLVVPRLAFLRPAGPEESAEQTHRRDEATGRAASQPDQMANS